MSQLLSIAPTALPAGLTGISAEQVRRSLRRAADRQNGAHEPKLPCSSIGRGHASDKIKAQVKASGTVMEPHRLYCVGGVPLPPLSTIRFLTRPYVIFYSGLLVLTWGFAV